MKIKMEQFPANNPAFSVGKDGTVLYSNVASEPLLNKWGAKIGDKLPSYIRDIVQRVISRNNPEKIEFKVGEKVYLIVFHPSPEEQCVNVSGFDISDQEDSEEKLRDDARFRTVQEKSLYGFTILQSIRDDAGQITDFEWTYMNEPAERSLGMSPGALVGKRMLVVHPGNIEERLFDAYVRVVEKGEPLLREVQYSHDGLEVFFRLMATKLDDGLSITFIDLTDLMRAKKSLKKSEEKFRGLFEWMGEAVQICELIWDEQGRPVDYLILDVNPAYEQQSGLRREQVVGRRIKEILPAVEQIRLDRYGEMVRTGKAIHFEEYNGELDRWFEVYASPSGGNRFSAVFMDITERKRMEETLRESEARIKVDEVRDVERQRLLGILETLLGMICLLTTDYHITFANRSFREKYGDSEGQHCYEYCFGLTKPCEFCESYKVLETGQPHHWEATMPDGSIIDTHDFPFTDIDGSPMILRMGFDITESRKAVEVLEKMDKLRIKEVHHRIKNNLQVISSMLDLQSDIFEDEKVKKAFMESQSRVISMALLHEELYKGEGTHTDKLDFSSYLQKLAGSLFQTYSLSSKNIRLCTDLEDNAFLDMDVAVPLGIIVNELVSNSLKHAFQGKDSGEIRIKLYREESIEFESEDCKSASFILKVSDNGIGIPENLEIKKLNGLGMQLVTTLVDQLDGELELKRNNGTEFIIRFTVKER